MKYWLNQWRWAGLDWLFPPVCGGCNQAGYRWRPDCQKQVQSVPEPVCQNCGLPISHPGKYSSYQTSNPQNEMMHSWLVSEGPIRYALHKLKYRRSVALGDALEKHLAEYVSILGWPVNLVVPVPLGKERRKERGYNQVGLVAKLVALIHEWRYSPRALVRIRETRSQIGLSIVVGRENAFGAFLGFADLVFRSTGLLKDDVATAGPTLASCALALMDAGAKSFYALTACSCVTPSRVD